MRRVLFVFLVMIPLAGRADALTLRDIVELNRSGLGEDVLLALIEVNQQIYTIDNSTILSLREQGLSEKVIVAIIKSGRTNRPSQPLLEAEPDPVAQSPAPVYAATPPVTVEQSNTQTQTVQVTPVAFPVFVPVAVRPIHRFDHFDGRRFDDRIHKVEPVFWGWGGKQRPDSWSLDRRPLFKPTQILDVPLKR